MRRPTWIRGGANFGAVVERGLAGVQDEEWEHQGVAQESPRQEEVLEKERGAPSEEVICDNPVCQVTVGAQHPNCHHSPGAGVGASVGSAA